MKHRIVGIVLAATALGLGVSACSEKPQALGETGRGTTVTRDTRPWEGDPLTFQTPYKRGDFKSWEDSLKLRQQAQNEYIRIGGR